jgi:hypothetical protein
LVVGAQNVGGDVVDSDVYQRRYSGIEILEFVLSKVGELRSNLDAWSERGCS